jgi:uncharacterized membrane protein
MNDKFDELAKGMVQSVTRRQALKLFGVGLAGMALACFGLANLLQAADPTFAAIDYPGERSTLALDINAGGQIVGRYIDAAGLHHGFLLSAGVFTPIDVPGALYTPALGINASGDVVGECSLTDAGGVKGVRGFLLHNGTFSLIDFPGAAQTRAIGINRNGDIVGYYTDQLQGMQKHHGFLLSGWAFISVDFPGAAYTDLQKINDHGQIAGRYRTSGNEKFHVFLLSDGNFIPLPDFPGAAQMAPTVPSANHSGLNGNGDLATSYCDSTPVQNNNLNANMLSNLHGLLLSGGLYTTIDFPGANGTAAFGINDSGVIVGCYADPTGSFHGFLRLP